MVVKYLSLNRQKRFIVVRCNLFREWNAVHSVWVWILAKAIAQISMCIGREAAAIPILSNFGAEHARRRRE